jgi:hypothetical protein
MLVAWHASEQCSANAHCSRFRFPVVGVCKSTKHHESPGDCNRLGWFRRQARRRRRRSQGRKQRWARLVGWIGRYNRQRHDRSKRAPARPRLRSGLSSLRRRKMPQQPGACTLWQRLRALRGAHRGQQHVRRNEVRRFLSRWKKAVSRCLCRPSRRLRQQVSPGEEPVQWHLRRCHQRQRVRPQLRDLSDLSSWRDIV